ncbi:MAG: DUF4304 domain-containing protein, partial [Bacteroidota bacterium]|nr:DUF4304 domain-containing protein [Bacteroidota bacterium]
MNAKEKQVEFIKTYLKPTLKKHGFSTSGNTWWRNCGDFFIVINLQNYSWNDKDNIDFRFNMGIALTATLADPQKKKADQHDLTVYVSENFHLPANRQEYKYKNNVGYSIKSDTDLDDFIIELFYDFEKEILPRLDNLKTLNDCIEFYKATFWVDNLKKLITQ